jgi:hypothetical protein
MEITGLVLLVIIGSIALVGLFVVIDPLSNFMKHTNSFFIRWICACFIGMFWFIVLILLGCLLFYVGRLLNGIVLFTI